MNPQIINTALVGLPCNPNITPRELKLLKALQDIVMETMQYPLYRPYSNDSYLPEALVNNAQAALLNYGLNLPKNRPAPKVTA